MFLNVSFNVVSCNIHLLKKKVLIDIICEEVPFDYEHEKQFEGLDIKFATFIELSRFNSWFEMLKNIIFD